METSQQRHVRVTSNRIRTTAARQQETLEERQERLARKQTYSATARHEATRQVDMWHRAAFSYNPATDDGADSRVSIGSMTVQGQHCGARKWPGETSGMCRSGGNISLQTIS